MKGDKNMDNKKIDQLLLELFSNKNSFREFYECTHTHIFAYIMSVIKNYDNSRDVMQEVYIKIYQASQNYHSMSKPLAWIYTIARNECYMYLRKRVYMDEYVDNVLLPKQIDKDTRMILEELFNLLNKREREVIIMHSLWGFKHYEIAKLLDISISTSLSCYHRGMKKMKKEMEIEI